MMVPLSIWQTSTALPGGLNIVDCFAARRADVEGLWALGASGKSEPVSLIAMNLNRTAPMHYSPLGKITETERLAEGNRTPITRVWSVRHFKHKRIHDVDPFVLILKECPYKSPYSRHFLR
jgi:hypothetical protein